MPEPLGPNDIERCPSEARRRTHLAHGVICGVCQPDEERPVRCPLCLSTVTGRGVTVLPHLLGGRGYGAPATECPGTGMGLDLPAVVERPVWPGEEPARPWRRRADAGVWRAIGAGS
jgi:hypothetical protein